MLREVSGDARRRRPRTIDRQRHPLRACAPATGPLEIAAARWTAAATTTPKLVAFDLAGAETGLPAVAGTPRRWPSPAGSLLHITIHASEPPGPRARSADALAHGAERIGHGVRLQTDIVFTTRRPAPSTARSPERVLDRRIALEMAPTCHVQIGAVPSFEEHPFAKLLRLGFLVTVNTDNRLMSNVTVSGETLALAEAFGLGWDELEQVAVNGAEAAFAPSEERRRLVEGDPPIPTAPWRRARFATAVTDSA